MNDGRRDQLLDEYNSDIQKRVARGIEFLDATMHEWWTTVEVNELDMKDTCKCVLGQTIGWSSGTEALAEWIANEEWVRPDEAQAYGFDAYGHEFDDLRDEWIHQINKRKRADG